MIVFLNGLLLVFSVYVSRVTLIIAHEAVFIDDINYFGEKLSLTDMKGSNTFTVPEPIAFSVYNDTVELSVPSLRGSNIMYESYKYRIQYRIKDDIGFSFLPTVISFQGSQANRVIQEVSTRSDIPIPCSGVFYLSLGVATLPDIENSISGPIFFNASVDEMKTALLSISKLSDMANDIFITQKKNIFHGYTWTISIINIDIQIPQLTLYRHDLQHVVSFQSVDDSTLVSYQQCFSTASAVSTKLINRPSQSNDLHYKLVNITELSAETTYDVRLVLTTSKDDVYIGNFIRFTTLKSMGSYSNTSTNIIDITAKDFTPSIRSFNISNIDCIFVNTSSITIQWNSTWEDTLYGICYRFDIEMAIGIYSKEFYYISSVDSMGGSKEYNKSTDIIASYTIDGLQPDAYYSFRVIPIFPRGRGAASKKVLIKTLPLAINYWEPIVTRVLASQASSNPFLPSPRQGHSLSLIDHFIYMFGGRTDGINCAGTYKDILNLGSPESGRAVYPCVFDALEVQELWRLDLRSYEWQILNGSNPADVPYHRQQHNAVIGSDSNLYIYGGRKTGFEQDSFGYPILSSYYDIVYQDLYVLDFVKSKVLTYGWRNSHGDNLTIAQNRRMFLAINATNSSSEYSSIYRNEGDCVTSLTIKVKFYHDCLKQLRFTLMGPGPNTLSQSYHINTAAYEVSLLDRRSMEKFDGCISGTQEFTFSDNSTRETDTCCLTDSAVIFKSEGKLSTFVGNSPYAEWTLVVEDTIEDDLSGYMISWSLIMEVSPCSSSASGTWRNLTSLSDILPPARYQAKTLAFDNYIFLFGGKDANHRRLDDLYRYDINTNQWKQLSPISFHIALDTSSSVGSNFLMTSWGLLRYGGYYRQPAMTSNGQVFSYVSDVFLLDPVSFRWTEVNVSSWPSPDGSFGDVRPNGRYLSSCVFIPSSSTSFPNVFSYRGLFDQRIASTLSNFAGAIADSIFLFGGANGATGSLYDGSSGGLLSDTWMLRLSNWSADGTRFKQQSYKDQHCKWRLAINRTIDSTTNVYSCISNASLPSCHFRDLLLLSWCAGYNFTLM